MTGPRRSLWEYGGPPRPETVAGGPLRRLPPDVPPDDPRAAALLGVSAADMLWTQDDHRDPAAPPRP